MNPRKCMDVASRALILALLLVTGTSHAEEGELCAQAARPLELPNAVHPAPAALKSLNGYKRNWQRFCEGNSSEGLEALSKQVGQAQEAGSAILDAAPKKWRKPVQKALVSAIPGSSLEYAGEEEDFGGWVVRPDFSEVAKQSAQADDQTFWPVYSAYGGWFTRETDEQGCTDFGFAWVELLTSTDAAMKQIQRPSYRGLLREQRDSLLKSYFSTTKAASGACDVEAVLRAFKAVLKYLHGRPSDPGVAQAVATAVRSLQAHPEQIKRMTY